MCGHWWKDLRYRTLSGFEIFTSFILLYKFQFTHFFYYIIPWLEESAKHKLVIYFVIYALVFIDNIYVAFVHIKLTNFVWKLHLLILSTLQIQYLIITLVSSV